jgi:hypothetical protein
MPYNQNPNYLVLGATEKKVRARKGWVAEWKIQGGKNTPDNRWERKSRINRGFARRPRRENEIFEQSWAAGQGWEQHLLPKNSEVGSQPDTLDQPGWMFAQPSRWWTPYCAFSTFGILYYQKSFLRISMLQGHVSCDRWHECGTIPEEGL